MIHKDLLHVALKGPSTYSLFPRLTSNGRLGGEGVRQWTLVRGIFGQKQTDALLYVMCGTALVT